MLILLLRKLIVRDDYLPTELPLILPWSKRLKIYFRGNTKHLKENYERILNEVTLADIDTNPYDRLTLKPELKKTCAVTTCLDFLNIAHHRPDLFPLQYGFLRNDTLIGELPSLEPPIKKIGPKKMVDMNADEMFKVYREGWSSRVLVTGPILEHWKRFPWMNPISESQQSDSFNTTLWWMTRNMQGPMTAQGNINVHSQMIHLQVPQGNIKVNSLVIHPQVPAYQ